MPPLELSAYTDILISAYATRVTATVVDSQSNNPTTVEGDEEDLKEISSETDNNKQFSKHKKHLGFLTHKSAYNVGSALPSSNISVRLASSS